jgi:hypothetical protein
MGFTVIQMHEGFNSRLSQELEVMEMLGDSEVGVE